MPEEPVFKITEKMYQTLVEWQEKIDEGEVMLQEEGQELAAPPLTEKPGEMKPKSQEHK